MEKGRAGRVAARPDLVCLVVGLLGIGTYYALSGLAQDALYDALRLAASIAIFLAGRRRDTFQARLPWYLIGIGQLLFAAGDVTWDFYKHVLHSDPFPSSADVFYLAAYPALAVGGLLHSRRALATRDDAAIVDAGIVTIGIGLAFWVLVVEPYAQEPGVSLLERAISLSYPLMDVLLVATGASLAFARGARTVAWSLWDAGLIALLVADISFLVAQSAGTYQDGTAIDAAFLLSGILWAASAWKGADAAPEPAEEVFERSLAGQVGRGRVTLLLGAAMIAPLLIAISQARDEPVSVGVVLGVIALPLLAIMRMAGVEVDRRVRRLAITAAAVGGVVTLAVMTVSALRLTYTSPELRAALETAQALIALLVTHLLYLRFRRTRLLSDLGLVYGLGLFAASSLFFVVALTVGGSPVHLVIQVWAPLLTRVVASVAILWASWAPPRVVVQQRRVVPTMVAAHLCTVGVVALVVVAFEGRLPVGVASGDVVLDGRPELIAHPAVIVGQLLIMAFAWLAAGGFLHQSREDTGPLSVALAIGFILAGFARLSFSQYPSVYTDIVHSGDFLRLGSYLVLLIGAERQIKRYWEGLAEVAVAAERERTARELHDGLVQELSFIRSQTAGVGSEGIKPVALQHVAKAAERALRESRDVLRVLKGEAAADLPAALRRAAEDVATRSGARVLLESGDRSDVRAEVVISVSRIVREACSNAVRHGNAKEITVRTERLHPGSLRVQVVDDGTGFDPRVVEDNGGFGLRSMRERAAGLGGELRISSSPGKGTVVEVIVPTG